MEWSKSSHAFMHVSFHIEGQRCQRFTSSLTKIGFRSVVSTALYAHHQCGAICSRQPLLRSARTAKCWFKTPRSAILVPSNCLSFSYFEMQTSFGRLIEVSKLRLIRKENEENWKKKSSSGEEKECIMPGKGPWNTKISWEPERQSYADIGTQCAHGLCE